MFKALLQLFSRGNQNTSKSRAKLVSGKDFAPTEGEALKPKVLIAKFDRDQSGATETLSNHLQQLDIWDIFALPNALKLEGKGNLAMQISAAAVGGSDLLGQEKADILLWGEVDGDEIRIRFQSAVQASDNMLGSYGLGDTLNLPTDFDQALEAVVYAAVLGCVTPLFRGSRKRLAESLNQYLEVTKPLIETPPAGLSQPQQASMLMMLGNAFAAMSRLGGGAPQVEDAITAYGKAKEMISADDFPVIWAVSQSHYASALRAKGERMKMEGGEVLTQASGAFEEIHVTLARAEHPFDWALAHMNQGYIKYRLGMVEGEAKYLQEAAKSFEQALGVYKQETMPGRWAEVMNQYGVVLLALGEQVSVDTVLEAAIKRFRQALTVRKKERSAELWAQSTNNLGAACFALAKRNSELPLLREAAGCFDGAIEVYRAQGAAKKAETISKNLVRAKRLLARHGE